MRAAGAAVVAAVLAALAVIGYVTLFRGDGFAVEEAAPDGPGRPATWTGAKDGLGTAYFDPERVSRSNVWYTLTRGFLSEVSYPSVATNTLRSLQLVVSDGKRFTDLEETDTEHRVELVHPDALVYRQVNTARSGRYRIEKTYVTDPQRHAVLVRVRFHALRGRPEDYRLWLHLDPSLQNTGPRDSGEVVERAGATYLVAREAETSLALGSSAPLERASVGFVGESDGLDELRRDHDLSSGYRSAADGNVAHLARLGLDGRTTFTLALGFGENDGAAIETARGALARPFEAVEGEYRRGWSRYLASLKEPTGDLRLWRVSAMTLRAHEDKERPGAFVASLTVPWGDDRVADNPNEGGYRLVWSRDLYQTATALIAIGDGRAALRALSYLDEVQQNDDGSFPQNTWPDGRPYWQSLQMDEVAFPILLAGQLDAKARWRSLVRPAADYLAANGPYSPQERWEEEGGLSPSTIAAEIAGLVVASRFAREAGDAARAARYLRVADTWARGVGRWTVRRGPLGPRPYYVRIVTSTDPALDTEIELNNGAGTHPVDRVVDAGFLELVRLGIKRPDDPLIVASLDVVDRQLRWTSPHGPVWYRYSFDRYGNSADGTYLGGGKGRPWPIFTGERGEYELALAAVPRGGPRPSRVYGPRRLLAALAGFANQGLMIPEQVWDAKPVPERGLFPGETSNSATPLAWSMAQYLRLAEGIRAGRVVETPPEVARHFGTRPAR